jgi:hypothetical protein
VQYDVDTNEVATQQTTIAPDTNNDGTIFSGKTNATMDVEKGEIYVLLKDVRREMETFTHSLWLFSLATREWSTIYKSYEQSQNNLSDVHFFVCCPMVRKSFLVGGNAERTDNITTLSLELEKPSPGHVLNYCKYLIRFVAITINMFISFCNNICFHFLFVKGDKSTKKLPEVIRSVQYFIYATNFRKQSIVPILISLTNFTN